MKHLLTILLCFLFVSLQAQVTIDNQYYNRSRSSNIWDRVVTDSILAAPSVKAAKGKRAGSFMYNSTLKTFEIYDSITATWYPLYRMTFSDGRISGAEVTWMGGLTFQVSSASYAIGGRVFNFEADDVALDAADPSLPRIDVITLDTLQQIVVIKGTPASDPAKPQIDPNKQIELTQVLINAGATEPADVTRRTVYDENVEFVTSSTWSTTVNFNNTTGPFNGTKAIAAGAFVAGNELKFTNALPLNVSNYNNFVFFVNLLATFSNANGFQISFWNGVSRVSSYVSVTNSNYGFSRTLTGSYQAINIPISAFSFTGSTFDIIKINMIGSSSSTFRMDFIQLQSGINQTISAPVASLQQVTNAGNITTNPIFAQQFGLTGGKAILFEEDNGGALEITDTSGNAAFSVYGSDTGVIRLANALNLLDVKWNKVSGTKTQYFANANGVIPMIVKVNGTDYVANDSGRINLGTIAGGGGSSYTFSAGLTEAGGTVKADTSLLATQYKLDTTRTGIRADLNGKQGALTLTTTGSSGAATLVGNTLNIPQYSGGGGGSADSSWVSSETGLPYSTLGTVINTNFASGTLPSGWTDNTPTATVTASANKLAFSGGVLDTGAYAVPSLINGAAYSNRVEIDYYNYDKMRYRFRFVPQTKNSTSRLAFSFLPNSLFFSSSTNFYFNLTNSDSSGMVVVRPFGSGTPYAVTNRLSFSVGDTLEVQIIREAWQITLLYKNRATGAMVQTSWSSSTAFGTGGKAFFAPLGGSQDLTAFAVDVYDRNNYGFTIIGDSQGAGSGATSEDKMFSRLLFNGNKTKYSNLSNGSVTLAQIVNSHVPNAIALNNPYVIVMAGYNDRRDLASDTNTYRQRLDSVVMPLIRAGLTPILTTLVPTANLSNANETNFTTAITNLATSRGLRIIRIDSALYISSGNVYPRSNMLAADAIHLSDSGQVVVYNKMLPQLPEIDTYLKTDTIANVVMYDVSQGNENMEHLVISNNKIYKYNNKRVDAIVNAYNRNGAGTIAQAGTEIHVSHPVKSDSAVLIHSRSGSLIGFNGGSNSAAGSVLPNFIASSRGVSGASYPQAWPTVTGSRNVIYEMFSTKGGSAATFSGNENFLVNNSFAGTISGSNNTVINSGGNFSLTSGSNHILLGTDAGRGISTGSRTIQFITRNTSGRSLASGLSDAIIFGDLTSALVTDNDYQAYDISFNTSYFNDENFWLGGREKPEKVIYVNFPAISTVSNYAGNDAVFRSGRGRGTGRSGYMTFQSWNSTTSGTTLHSTASTEMVIENKKVRIDNRFQTSTGADVASANDLTLGNDGNVFTITGTTQINAITTTNWQAGSEIILIFSGSVTVKNATSGGANTAQMLLAGSADFSATANDVLRLVFNGTSWFEVSRSVN